MSLITIDNVQIKGLTVEIKSLVVGKKQLTLSLMRQFINESIIDFNEVLLKGVPWGFINYFWGDDKEKTPDTHLHLIWQKGNELRRCVLARKVYLRELEESICTIKHNYRKEYEKHTALQKEIHSLKKTIVQLEELYADKVYSYLEGELKSKNETLDIRIKSLKESANNANQLIDECNKVENERDRKKKKYEDLILSMKDLPHFFISV